jgi:hypothetical protein
MRPAVRMAMDMVSMPMQGTDLRTAHARVTVATSARSPGRNVYLCGGRNVSVS